MSPLESYWLSDYQEWKDFLVEMQKNIHDCFEGDFKITHHLYFRDIAGNLLWYIRLFVEKKDNAWRTGKTIAAYIVDIISSSAYENHFSQTRKKSFIKQGYTPWIELPGFWPTMMTYALSYVREYFPEASQVLVVSNQQKGNIQAVWDVSFKVQERTRNLIEKLNGWWENCTVTIWLIE